MLKLDHENFIADSILTFNYHYSPGVEVNVDEVKETTNSIIKRLEYYNCLDVNYILKELIQVMRTNNYNVLNHFEEFKPNNLIYLLKLLGVNIKKYYS